jgi:hypothetical protein
MMLINTGNGSVVGCRWTMVIGSITTTTQKYSAVNHKRATAAECRESHHLRADAATAVPFRSAVVWLTASCSGGALVIERTV